MSVMASNGVFTRDDLEALPDDGLRHELIDGAIFPYSVSLCGSIV